MVTEDPEVDSLMLPVCVYRVDALCESCENMNTGKEFSGLRKLRGE